MERIPGARRRPLRVLAVIDGSARTGRVIEFALELAPEARGIEAILLGVIPDPPDGRLRGYGSFKAKDIHTRLKDLVGARAIAAAARRFDQAGVTHQHRLEVGDPAETILRVAGEETCDVILLGEAPVGTFRRWSLKATGVLTATVATKVAQLAAIPVVVVK
jgi:nucleotide-binding universal stress UspA family protein